MPSILDRDKVIWAAGFLEGEGCFTINRNRVKGKVYHNILISAAQKKKRPLEKLLETLGGTISLIQRGSISSTRGQTYYNWSIRSREAYTACAFLLPFLIEKKEQAQLLIDFQNECIGKPGEKIKNIDKRDCYFEEAKRLKIVS